MRNTVRPCVPLDGKKVLLVGQCFAIQRHILLLRHVFIYVSGRNLCVTRQLLFYPSPPFTSHHLNLKIAFTLKTYYES